MVVPCQGLSLEDHPIARLDAKATAFYRRSGEMCLEGVTSSDLFHRDIEFLSRVGELRISKEDGIYDVTIGRHSFHFRNVSLNSAVHECANRLESSPMRSLWYDGTQ